jgi:alpha-tubulin suppressor-like RCC1 family protein
MSAAAPPTGETEAPSVAPAPAVATTTEVLVAGNVSHSLTGRSNPPSQGYDGVPETCLFRFARFSAFTGKRIVRVYTGCTSVHYFAATAEGALYAWGRNEKGQLGLGDTRNRYAPVLVPLPGKVVACATGKAHTLVVLEGGVVMAAGDNKVGQCGVGKAMEVVPRFERCLGFPQGAPIAPSVSAGSEFSCLIAGEALYTCGSQEFGQCGTGATGEYIVSAGKTAFKELTVFTRINPVGSASVAFTQVASGACHTVALSATGVPYTWGFGAYGRLGHGKPADVLTPTPISFFEHDRLVSWGFFFVWGGLLGGRTLAHHTNTYTRTLFFTPHTSPPPTARV